MSKRVALYARVSSEGQEDNTSLGNQLTKCRDYALRHGFEVITEKQEVITGASRWGARIEFNQLLDLGKAGEIDAIIVDVKDRLGRGRALATLCDRAEQSGVDVLFADNSDLTDVELGVSIIVSGLERDKIGRRTREGKLRAAEKGNIVSGTAPYGYEIVRTYDERTGKRVDARLEVLPDESQPVIDMFTWLVCEHETLYGITKRLYRARVLPRQTIRRLIDDFGYVPDWDDIPDRIHKDDGGYTKTFARATVRAILKNEIYVGRWFYNKRQIKRRERGNRMKQEVMGYRDKSEWVCIDAPPILDEETFQRAQDVLRNNKLKQNGRPTDKKTLLKGLIQCACGWRLIGLSNGKSERARYRCNKRIQPGQSEKDYHTSLDLHQTDRLVWEYIEGLAKEPERLLAEYEARQAESAQGNAALLERVEYLKASILEAGVRVDRLVDLYTDGDLDRKTYRKKRAALESTIEGEKAELAIAMAELSEATLTDDDKTKLIEFCESMQESVENATFEQKRQILLALDVKVQYLREKEAIKITGAFPKAEVFITRSCDIHFPLVFSRVVPMALAA